MCLFLKGELQIPYTLNAVPKFADLTEPKLNKDKTE